MLNEPTPLLERYLEAALKEDYDERLKLATGVFEDMLANVIRYMPSKGIAFTKVLEKLEARHAFETAYKYSTTVRLDLQRLKQGKTCFVISNTRYPQGYRRFYQVLLYQEIHDPMMYQYHIDQLR